MTWFSLCVIAHDWFTEHDVNGQPLYRICHRCGKYEDAVLIEKTYEFQEIEPGTVTQTVERLKNKREWNTK